MNKATKLVERWSVGSETSAPRLLTRSDMIGMAIDLGMDGGYYGWVIPTNAPVKFLLARGYTVQHVWVPNEDE